MRKILLLCVAIFILFLSGCREKNTVINYEGGSPSWQVSYKIEGNEEYHDSYYTFKYVGNPAHSINEVEYEIDGPKEGETGRFTLNDAKEHTGKMRATGGLPRPSDRDINVTVKWDEQTEVLILRRKK